jgi:hypothetical protein
MNAARCKVGVVCRVKVLRPFYAILLLLILHSGLIAQVGGATTTTDDSKYGAGGKYISVSDGKLKLTREMWLDPQGRVRAVHQPHMDERTIAGGTVVADDVWTFNWPGKSYELIFHFDVKHPEKGSLTVHLSQKDATGVTKTEAVQVLESLDRSKFEGWVSEIENALAEKAPFPSPWEEKTAVEPPKIAPAEVVQKQPVPPTLKGLKCVAGRWTAEGSELIEDGTVRINPAGISLEISPDSTAVFNFSKMQPATYAAPFGGNPDFKFTTTAQGTTSAKLTVDDSNLSINGDVTSAVKFTEKQPDGSPDRVVKKEGFFPGIAQSAPYSCDKDTLVLKLPQELRFKRDSR